ncbi:MAG: putative RND superfamily exporter protein, partial [Hyphomicrobiaceae bacterium]
SMFIMMPTLVTAVGVADSVHILTEFRAFEAELGDRRQAVARTMYLVGPPCLLTSLTTSAGFFAMSFAPIRAISEFGIYAAGGVLAAFVLSVTFLMVFLTFTRPPRQSPAEQHRRAKGGERTRRALTAIARMDQRHPRKILVISGVIFALSIVGMTRIEVDSNFLDDFDDHHPVRITTEFVDSVMGGLMSIVYVFDSGEPEGVKDPAVMRQIDGMAKAAQTAPLVSKTYSVTDIVADINETFHDGDKAFYVIPETRDLIGQYLLLYELSGGDEAYEFLSGDFSRASLELHCHLVESSAMVGLVEAVDEYREGQDEQPATVVLTGIGSLWIQLMEYITISQLRSFVIALIAISIMMCVVFRSIPIGLISMLPNLAPVVLTVGAMGWFDIRLDYVKMLIAPVAIGIAVDDTIHHMTRFRYEFTRSGNYAQALEASMLDVGRALFITSTVLVLGFLVFTLSALDAQEAFGLLLGATIIAALAADFILMPALVMVFQPFGPEGDPSPDPSPEDMPEDTVLAN